MTCTGSEPVTLRLDDTEDLVFGAEFTGVTDSEKQVYNQGDFAIS